MDADAPLGLSRAHFPVTVLGPGRRIGLWLQGCSIRCAGCVSRDTWETGPGQALSVGALLQWCREASGGELDGVTLSGGEPFDQPDGLAALLRGLIAWRDAAGRDFDLLCYSGYPLATLRRRHPGVLALLDAIIPEPFVMSRPLGGIWRGSDNQPLVPLSERGRRVYASWIDRPAEPERIQVAVEPARIWFIGIPARGELARLAERCRADGLDLAKTSWQ